MPQYRFGDYVVDSDVIEIAGPNGVADVEPQVFDVLTYLIEQQGRLVTKEELLDNVWGDRFVSESALTTRIKQARRAIGDDGRSQWAIKTVHGRGYRFLPNVTTQTAPVAEPGAAVASTPTALPEGLRADTRQLFCGRHAELATCLEVVDQGEGHDRFGMAWILGEPGIGKTRLAAEVARAAQQRGHQVVFGRNSEDLRVPYQPFIEVIRQLVVGSGDIDGLPSQFPPELLPLLPEMHADRSSGPESSVDSETRRYQMFEALAQWLAEQAAESPVTMIIDDVHWAADSTLQLLGHLQRREGPAPVTLVLTARDTAPDISSRVADLLAAGQGRQGSVTVRLEGLSSDDAVRLVGDDAGLDEIMRQTAGNPLFLQAVNPADGSVDMDSAVHRRLASLDQGVQETLKLMSVLGLEFELKIAAAANDRDELDLLDDLEQAVAARLLDDVGLDRFRFTHALIRSSLRGELSSARRVRMHERIAAAIERVFPGDARHLPELAFHTAEAAVADHAMRPLAIERLSEAAAESTEQFSFEEAGQLLERARSLADPTDSVTVATLALDQGIAETRSGRNMVATRTFEVAVAAARSTGDPVLRAEAAVRYEDAAWRPGLSGVDALHYLREARFALDSAAAAGLVVEREDELRARMAIGELRALAMSGELDQLEAAFAKALALATVLDSPNLEAAVLNVYLGQVRFSAGHEGTEPMIDRLAELEPLIDDSDVALHAIHDRMLHATLAGQFGRLRGLVETMAELQERSHSRFWAFIRSNQEAMEAFYRGDLEASEATARNCLELAESLPDEDGAGTFGLRMFMIRREQDRLAAVTPMVRLILSQAEGDALWTPGLALLLVETGSAAEAAEALRPVKEAGFDLPIDSMWSTVMVFLIETMVQLGDVDACAVLRDRFSRLAGTNVATGSGLMCFGRAERYLGMLSFMLGDLEAAEQYLGAALEADSAGDSVLWSNESRLWLARVRRAQGHEIEADAMLSVVVSQARGAGLARLERLATAELAG